MRGAPSWDDRDRGQGRADDGRNQAPTRVSIVGPLELWAHRFPVAGRIQRVAKRGWRLPSPARRDRLGRPSRVATVTPYLSQSAPTVESASGESWGRLARTSAAVGHP